MTVFENWCTVGDSSCVCASRMSRSNAACELCILELVSDRIIGEGTVPSSPPQKFFFIFSSKIMRFGKFWVLFFTVWLPVLHANN